MNANKEAKGGSVKRSTSAKQIASPNPQCYPRNSIAESVDRTIEEGHWRQSFKSRPYVELGAEFDDYGPAYSYGVDGFIRHSGRTFDEVEPELANEWHQVRGRSRLDWPSAAPASRDAWERVSSSRQP